MSHGQRHDFEFPSDLSRFPSRTRPVLEMARDLGWQVRWLGTEKRLACIVSPNREKSLNVPTTSINANRMKSYLSQIRTYSDPEKFDDWVEENMPGVRTAIERKARERTPLGETVLERAMREAQEKAEAGEPASTTEASQQEHAEEVSQVVKAEPEDYVPADTVVVTEKPWMVRRGGQADGSGRMYESPHVIERIHKDGRVDYRCRWCSDYENENPRSVAVHAAKRHPDHKAPAQPQGRKVTHYKPTEIKRPMSAARRLASEMLHVLDSIADWQQLDREELARRLAEGVYDQRPDREPVAELTDEQIVSRIVGLVDKGRLADMHQKMEEMAAVMREQSEVTTAAQVRAEQAEAAAEALREERRTLAALLSEERGS